MEWWHTIILAIIQGLTEFLPISSSAHLILIPKFLGWSDQGLGFDAAIHLGTLLATLIYFRHTLKKLFFDWFKTLSGHAATTDSHLAWGILVATIPVGMGGLFFKHWIEENLRSYQVIAITTLFFGILLGLSDWFGKKECEEKDMSWKSIIFIGIAQAIALVPGTSRSGITLTAGLFLGLTKSSAARVSFFLAIPVIFLASGMSLLEVYQEKSIENWSAIGLGVFIAFISAYACIHTFLKLLNKKIGLLPFVIYRIILGILLFAIY